MIAQGRPCLLVLMWSQHPPLPFFRAQVLILKDFQDFPSEELTLEFWMLSTGGVMWGMRQGWFGKGCTGTDPSAEG